MKKLLALALIAVLALSFAACTPAQNNNTELPTFTPLTNGEVLCIGQSNRFFNYKSVQTYQPTLRCVVDAVYSLRRVSTNYYTYEEFVSTHNKTPIEYDGYYYYWEETLTYDEIQLGTITRTTYTTYDYLPFGEDKDIVVRSCTKTEIATDYAGGMRDFSFDYTILLNGYFANESALRSNCPELYNMIDTDGIKQYYVDTSYPTSTSYDQDVYTDTYYYFENCD